MRIYRWLIFFVLLLALPIVYGFSGNGSSFSFGSSHTGLHGLSANGSTISSRFTLDYNQPGNLNANGSIFSASVGWLGFVFEEVVTAVEPAAAAAGGGGRGGGGGGSQLVAECNDRLDNDRDGLVDMKDPDCAGILDANEGGEPACISSWSCTTWSDCDNGKQTRICSDNNGCATDRLETRTCEEVEEEVKEEKPAVFAPQPIKEYIHEDEIKAVAPSRRFSHIIWFGLLVFALICISLSMYYYLSQPTPIKPIGYQQFKEKITFTPTKQYQPDDKVPILELKEIRKRIKRSGELLRRIK